MPLRGPRRRRAIAATDQRGGGRRRVAHHCRQALAAHACFPLTADCMFASAYLHATSSVPEPAAKAIVYCNLNRFAWRVSGATNRCVESIVWPAQSAYEALLDTSRLHWHARAWTKTIISTGTGLDLVSFYDDELMFSEATSMRHEH
eukprot:6197108-Pleurochrysis_carterae.AAC.1